LDRLFDIELVLRARVQGRITARGQPPVEHAPVTWTDIGWVNVLILDRIDQGKHQIALPAPGNSQ
jgi:hypothetical protein